MRSLQVIALGLPASRLQYRHGTCGVLSGGRAGDKVAGSERGAAVGCQRQVDGIENVGRGRHQGRTGLHQIGQRRVVIERFASACQRVGAAPDAQPGIGHQLDLRLCHRDAADQALGILLGGSERCTCAIGHAGRNHDGVDRAQVTQARDTVAGYGTVPFVQYKVGKLNRLQRPLAPVFFRVLLRVRVLDGKAVGRGRVEGGQLRAGHVGREDRRLACHCGVCTHAVLNADGVVLQVMDTVASALVGVSHGAAVFQAPFPRRADGTIHTTGAAGRCRDDASIGRVERGWYLDHHGDVLGAAAIV